MLNATAEDIHVKLDKQIHPDVATAYNLAPIEFAARQFNEPRFSYFVRRMITDYVTKRVNSEDLKEVYTLICDEAYRHQRVPVQLVIANIDN